MFSSAFTFSVACTFGSSGAATCPVSVVGTSKIVAFEGRVCGFSFDLTRPSVAPVSACSAVTASAIASASTCASAFTSAPASAPASTSTFVFKLSARRIDRARSTILS